MVIESLWPFLFGVSFCFCRFCATLGALFWFCLLVLVLFWQSLFVGLFVRLQVPRLGSFPTSLMLGIVSHLSACAATMLMPYQLKNETHRCRPLLSTVFCSYFWPRFSRPFFLVFLSTFFCRHFLKAFAFVPAPWELLVSASVLFPCPLALFFQFCF